MGSRGPPPGVDESWRSRNVIVGRGQGNVGGEWREGLERSWGSTTRSPEKQAAGAQRTLAE